MTGLTVAGLIALALGAKKAADHKLMKTQELTASCVIFLNMGEIATLYVQIYSSLERLVGVISRMVVIIPLYESSLVYEEEVLWLLN